VKLPSKIVPVGRQSKIDAMTISVVIPAYRGLDFLKANLPTVTKLGADEIIIVNDVSPDGTLAFLSDNYPDVRVVNHVQNTRFPIAVNDGVAAAKSDYILLLNQDVQPDPKLISKVQKYFSRPKLFAVTFNDGHSFWATGRIEEGIIQYGLGSGNTHTHPSLWASGGACAFKKSIWQKLGGFDPIFTPGYFEDLDLGLRALKSGYEIIGDKDIKIIHQSPESAFNSSLNHSYLRYIKDRNYLLVHWKNLDSKYLFSHIYSLASRIFHHPGFIIPTLLAIVHLPHVLAFRRTIASRYILTDPEIYAKLS